MKKLVLGLGLLHSGVVGFVGWCIAAVQKVEPGAVSVVFGCIRGVEWLVLAVFACMALAGLCIAIREAAEKK